LSPPDLTYLHKHNQAGRKKEPGVGGDEVNGGQELDATQELDAEPEPDAGQEQDAG